MQEKRFNRLFYVLVLLVLAGSYSTDYAQSKELVKTIDQIFKLCESKNFSAAQKFCFANSGDKSAQRLTKKISAYLKISDSYKIEGAQVNSKGKTEEHIVNISFLSGGRKLGAEFIFVKEKDKFLLKDIN